MTEAKYQSKVIKRYQSEGYFVIKLIQTNVGGMTDLLCLKEGTALFVEVKGEKTRVTPLQKKRHEQLRAHGFEVRVDRYKPSSYEKI